MDCDGGRRKSTRIQHLKSRKRENKSGLNQTAAAKKMKVSRSKPEKSGEIGSAVVENGSIEVKEEIKPVKERVVEPIVAESVKPSENGTVAVKSAYAKVIDTVRDFNKHFLHFVQEEEIRCRKDESSQKKAKGQNFKGGQKSPGKKSPGKKSPGKKIISPKKAEKIDASKEDTKNRAKRPDLKALTKMTEINAVIKPASRIGNVPGIDVGHKFFSRAEMVVVGFHCHWLNGIDYIGTGDKKGVYKDYTLPLTVCIVISGQYEDDVDNAEKVIYTGQGGNNLLGDKRQIRDQQLLRGNLGLKNSMDQDVPIRVVRGHVYKDGIVGKVYTYDGLYKVEKYWAETGISGFTVYKFELKRLEGQCSLTTEQVNYTRAGVPKSLSEIRGLVCEDISGGKENLPIPATNLVDDPPLPPTGFTYINKLKISKGVEKPANASGCDCEDDGGGCKDPRSCSCAKLNGRNEFPYVQKDGGRLIEAQGVVFECGPNCGCGPDCVNRVSQKGIKHRLEVFKTASKGWGVRSWDTIRSGSMICEYIGVLRITDELDAVTENSYIFDIDCLQTMKGLEGRERRFRDVSISHLVKDEDKESGPEFCIDAGSTGNVARFINHSCQPNLFVQCVLSDHHDVRLARIILFAADNIPALKELTYDYGYVLGSVIGADGKIKEMACYCGAADCRKRLF